MSVEKRVATFLYDARWINLGLLILGTLAAVYQFRYFNVDHNLLRQVNERSVEVVRINELENTFGRSDLIVVALKADDIFTEDALAELKRLSGELEKVRNVESMLSLSNATVLENDFGEVRTVRVMEAYENGEQSLAAFKEAVLNDPNLRKMVISEDGTAAAINLFIDEKLREADERDELMDTVQAKLDTITAPEVTGFYTGNNPLIVDAIRSMEADMERYFWMTPLIMGILLVLLFRRGNAVAIPLILIFVSVAWTLGVFFGLRKSLGLATSLLPTLIALITLSDVIHAMALYFASGNQKSSNRERIILTLEHLLGACFMTSVTTAIGIGSLVSSQVESIRQFGFWAAVGIVIAYWVVMMGLPILLSLFPGKRQEEKKSRESFWNGIFHFTVERRGWILGVSVGVLLLCGLSTQMIRVESQMSDSLPQNTPAMRGLKVVDEQLSGIGNFEAVIKGEPGVFEEPWALAEVKEIHEFFETIPEMNLVISPWSILRDLHAVLEEGEESPHGLPSSRVDVREYYYMLGASASAEKVKEFVVEDHSWARVSGRSQGLSSLEYLRYFRSIDEFAEENLDPRLELHTTGRMKVFSTSVTLLVNSLMSSLTWTLVLIAVLLVIHFRSLKIGAISLLPNLVPVLVPLGLMGIFDIPLTAATVMVSCLAVGLAVDNAIHFLARYRWELRQGLEIEEALRLAMTQTGRAIVIVSIVIAGGFTIFLFSEFAPNRYFGFLLAVSMLTAPVVDLLLLPILIRLIRVKC